MVAPLTDSADAAAPQGEPADEPDAELDIKRIVRLTVVGVLLLMGVLGLVAYLLREPFVAISRGFVEQLHGFGVALGFYVPDAFTVPLPNDAFTTLGLVGGLGFWEVVAWGTLGSILGGITGYGVGRWLKRTRWFKRFMAKRGAEVHGLVRRYGVVALGAAALTPIPYSIACWAAGALDMRFGVFVAVSLLRFFRVAGYLYLIHMGVISIIH